MPLPGGGKVECFHRRNVLCPGVWFQYRPAARPVHYQLDKDVAGASQVCGDGPLVDRYRPGSGHDRRCIALAVQPLMDHAVILKTTNKITTERRQP